MVMHSQITIQVSDKTLNDRLCPCYQNYAHPTEIFYLTTAVLQLHLFQIYKSSYSIHNLLAIAELSTPSSFTVLFANSIKQIRMPEDQNMMQIKRDRK